MRDGLGSVFLIYFQNEMKTKFYNMAKYPAFTLAEVLAVLIISSMVLIAAIGVYDRVQNASAAITRRLDNYLKPAEVLQMIAQDLDNIVTEDKTVKITIPRSKIDNKFPVSQLKIEKTYTNLKDEKTLLEMIDWQTAYDFDTDSVILYRGHSGITVEDKLLDKNKEKVDRELYIPICSGVTYFDVQVLKNDELLDEWTSDSLPRVVVVTISFAEPYQDFDGEWKVPEDKLITRAMSIDKTRKVSFDISDINENGQTTQLIEEANVPK